MGCSFQQFGIFASSLLLCLAASAQSAAQGRNPRSETEARSSGRAPNPVVNRSSAPGRRGAKAARRGGVNDKVEEALELGNKAMDDVEHEKAIMFYRRALSINPKEPRAYVGLGNAEIDIIIMPGGTRETTAAGLKRAEDYYKKALALNEKEWMAYIGLGNLYTLQFYVDKSDKTPLERAETAFKKALALNPNAIETWHALAEFYKEQNRLDAAAATIRQALSVRQSRDLLTYTYQLLGEVLGKQERDGEAEQLYREGIRKSLELYDDLGMLLENQKRYDEAKQVYKEWSRTYPREDEPHYRLGSLYVTLGKKSAALEQYNILKQRKSEEADEHARRLLRDINRMEN